MAVDLKKNNLEIVRNEYDSGVVVMLNRIGKGIQPLQLFKFSIRFNDYCCGQVTLGGISLHPSQKKEYIELITQLLKDSLNTEYGENRKVNNLLFDALKDKTTSVILTLSEEQPDSVHQIFKDAGFTELSKFKNPKTGNYVTNYEGIMQHELEYETDEDDDYLY